jgi:hypothetical protein
LQATELDSWQEYTLLKGAMRSRLAACLQECPKANWVPNVESEGCTRNTRVKSAKLKVDKLKVD